MNRLSRAGIAVALLASVLWSGGVAEAGRLAVDESVCVNASSGVVSLVTYNTRFCSKQNWSDSKPAPPLCWLDSSTVRQDLRRSISIAPASGCILPFRSVPAGEVLLLCADGLSGLLRWPVTGACFSYNWKTWVRSASAPNPASPPTDFTTTSTTSTTAVVVPSVSLSTTWIQSITFPKAVTVTANVAGTIYFAEGAFVVKTVSDITSAPSYRWAKGTVASANTPTSIAIDVDAVTNGYYRVYVANSQGVLSAPATNIVTISIPRTPIAAEIAAGTTTTTVPPVCDGTAALCRVGVDTGPGGGPIFYYSETAFTSTGSTCNTNCHYLEAAPSDQSTAILWATTAPKCWRIANGSNNNDCQTFSVYSPHDTPNQANSRTAAPAIGKGKLNTDQIHSRFTLNGGVSTSSYGAGVARAYTNNSKTDWFLPSQLELNQMCRYAWNLTVDNTATTCTGMSGTIRTGFSTGLYWGSSEFDDMTVRAQNFNDGSQLNGAKSLTMRVRPVRAG
jgi:hypothetical protein